MTVLALDDLATGYRSGRRSRQVSAGLSATLRAGEFTVLLGPNGAGKSTLMRTVCGLTPPLGGTALLDGEAIDAMEPGRRARVIGVVLTPSVNVWGLTGRALVELGRQPHTGWWGRFGAEDHDAVDQALRATGSQPFAARQVAELSDGERQRVMIARALAQQPRALVLDEVTAFLDLPTRIDLMIMLRDLTRAEGRALLLSTHDLDLALRTADRIWLMDSNGNLEVGTPEDLVLSGSLAHVFHREGVEFDPWEGAFRMAGPERVGVRVEGSGLVAEWTRRALRRLGIGVSTDGVTRFVIAVEDGTRGRAKWRLEVEGAASNHDTMSAMIDALLDSIPGDAR
ncbi:MAG: ABC transporter ATP-binding protein [Gemmatimonadota bacterium]|uniref:ABC transporter ATP-binding protein n=1 Tax=Candidatus Palauibacter scopulicola TaxID=3056741 RepID=UPI0023831AC1|nr:ABC transporter ATP-binding protein [Candidatus Palauibacter scopulicola]MDE2663781.1 ABC transporter ATP-binding protein [Candidatus Palauibacter scopulicola]